mgnify:CR=1 FL=1
MAKMMKEKMMRGAKCTCNPGWMILAAIVMAIGVFLGVQGFVIQLSLTGGWGDSTTMAWILGLYFVGILLVGAAKFIKWHSVCPVHGTK